MPEDMGLLIVSCDRGDIRHSKYGLYVYDDEGLHDVDLTPDRAMGVGQRRAELEEFYDGDRAGQAALPRRPLGHGDLEVCLAIMQSAEERKEIMLQHQVPSPTITTPTCHKCRTESKSTQHGVRRYAAPRGLFGGSICVYHHVETCLGRRMSWLVRKNLMVDAEALHELAKLRGERASHGRCAMPSKWRLADGGWWRRSRSCMILGRLPISRSLPLAGRRSRAERRIPKATPVPVVREVDSSVGRRSSWIPRCSSQRSSNAVRSS